MEVGESIAIVVEVKIASHDDSSNRFIPAFWSIFLKTWWTSVDTEAGLAGPDADVTSALRAGDSVVTIPVPGRYEVVIDSTMGYCLTLRFGNHIWFEEKLTATVIGSHTKSFSYPRWIS
jgi:hypothetical protein